MVGPMVERLLAAGNEVHLFARRPDVARKLTAIARELAGFCWAEMVA